MEALVDPILQALDELLKPANVVLRADSPSRALEGLSNYVRAAKGEVSTHLGLEENGTRYFADLSGGQKTGWYYDQRDNRAFNGVAGAQQDHSRCLLHSGGSLWPPPVLVRRR